MRLLYVIDSLAPGGAESSLVEMAPGLIASGIDLHVLPLGARLDLQPALEQAGAAVHTSQAGLGRLGNLRSVIDTARAIRPELVHTTLFEADISGRAAARLGGIPASTSLVGDTYGPSRRAEVNHRRLRLALSIDRLTARHAVRFHAVSEWLATQGAENLRVDREHFDVIPRGRDPEKYPFRQPGRRETTRTALGIPLGAPVVLAVGRLEPVKGLHTLLNSLTLLTPSHPGTVLLVAGKEGRASHDLHAAAARVRAEVRFLGHRDDVPHLLAAADVLCFPSVSEGSPGSLIEAMAVGCPIVASDIPPNREVLATGDRFVGRLAPPGDHIAFADQMIKVLSDQLLTDKLVNQARTRFERSFTIQTASTRMSEFFNRARAESQ